MKKETLKFPSNTSVTKFIGVNSSTLRKCIKNNKDCKSYCSEKPGIKAKT